MDKAKLDAILAAHRLWLASDSAGIRANLRSADLRSANLRSADLRSADLSSADLRSANLRSANLSSADLRSANLRSANLSSADLSSADLRRANLRSANLSSADLSSADLRSANLRSANLSGANLPHFQLPPSEGAFIAWKKASGCVLKLEIPADAQRTSSLVGRKCRASAVLVLEITGNADIMPDGVASVTGDHDESTVYVVGEITRPDSYNDDIRLECTNGIHFFMTRREAEEY